MPSAPSSEALDALVSRWHDGEFPDHTLQEVICAETSWSDEQYARWVVYGSLG